MWINEKVLEILGDGFCERCAGTLGTEECECETDTETFRESFAEFAVPPDLEN